MLEGYDFDIARVGDRILYEHEAGDQPLLGIVTKVKTAADYDRVVHVEVEDGTDLTVRMHDENIGAGYYSVDLLDWER